MQELERYGLSASLPAHWRFADLHHEHISARTASRYGGPFPPALGLRYYKLGDVFEHLFSAKIDGAHEAVADAAATCRVFACLQAARPFVCKDLWAFKDAQTAARTFFGYPVSAADDVSLPDHFPLKMVRNVAEDRQGKFLVTRFPTIGDLRRLVVKDGIVPPHFRNFLQVQGGVSGDTLNNLVTHLQRPGVVVPEHLVLDTAIGEARRE